jgi:hypothetical protein
MGEAVMVGVAAGDDEVPGTEASTWASGLPAGDGGGAVGVMLPQPASRHATVSAIEGSFVCMARTSIS